MCWVTALHQDRVQLLNNVEPRSDIVIVNMTNAFLELFHNGEDYGE